MKFIEVTTLSKIESFNDGVISSRFEKETELINIDNIALVGTCGDIYLKRGYPNGSNVCKTDHTYQEIKDKIDQCKIDHFAGLAMQGIISAGSTMRGMGGEYTNWSERDTFPVSKLVKESYLIAKAMLKERRDGRDE